MSDHIIIETEDMVTTLTISRENKKNAITQAMYSKMADAINEYGASDTARAMIITGSGDMFTAGNDLQDFATGVSFDTKPPVIQFLDAIRDCPKPLIAAVNGGAIGVGLTMLLHCDLVYALESATFNAPFVKLGLVPEAGSSMLLPATVGMAVANDILLAGRQLDAQEAHAYGLVSRVFSAEEFKPSVKGIAQQIAASAPSAVKKSKALIRNNQDNLAAHMDAETEIFAAQLKSPDFMESVAAMMQKRSPVYK